MRILLGILFSLAPILLFGQNNDLQNKAVLASQYYQNKEFGKAAELYEELYSATKAETYFNMYFDCLLGIQEYDKAEKAVKKGLRGNSSDAYWYVQLGFLKRTLGDTTEAEKMYDKAIASIANTEEMPNLANQFLNRREYDFAKKVFLKARQAVGSGSYNYELARVYYYMRSYDRMLNEYLDWTKQKESNLEMVKANLVSVLSMDSDGEIIKQLRNVVLKRIQQEPDQIVFSRVLIWLFIQEGNFVAAIRQATALDKRTNNEAASILDLANVSASNKYYDDAAKAYDYLIAKGRTSEFYYLAAMQQMRMNYERFLNDETMDPLLANEIRDKFVKTFGLVGSTPDAIDLVIDYAHLLAFYINQPTEAIRIINEWLGAKGINLNQVQALKEELADVYVYSGDLWEAVITYSQVIEANKSNLISDDVKFKKAKLGYYMGNFAWAKAQLNALRASTSKLIANDAMDLSLFINENMEDDSISVPLKMFARADLQTFRNNFSGAIAALDSVATLYADNSLTDDVLYRKATIFQKQRKYAEAADLYSKVVKDFSWDLLADDALFQLANLYNYKLNRKPEAKDLYRKMMTDFPGSVYVVDSRTEYRKLESTEPNANSQP
jgi:tetratricopeptide (TPR) repeat protein